MGKKNTKQPICLLSLNSPYPNICIHNRNYQSSILPTNVLYDMAFISYGHTSVVLCNILYLYLCMQCLHHQHKNWLYKLY